MILMDVVQSTHTYRGLGIEYRVGNEKTGLVPFFGSL